MNIEKNIFDNPEYYRKLLVQTKGLINYDVNQFKGKSLICVFFTSYCGVGCPFCFFHSPNLEMNNDELVANEKKFSETGIQKFISFANKANVGYLQISGGGEPFLEKNAILQCVEKISADRIILVTSGSWAYDIKKAESYLDDLFKTFKKRKKGARLTIRVSISKYHSIRLKEKPLVNLLRIFEKKYKNQSNFTLQLKTFENDSTLENYLEQYFKGYKFYLEKSNATDDEKLIKVIPWKYTLKLASGYKLIVGKSRIFNSNLRPDMHDKNSILINESIYDTDLLLSQKNNSSIVFDSDGNKGLDWIVEYNGNVCTWQNRIQDNLLNIYEDDYNYVLDATLTDLLTYSYIDKGSKYRENIINEVSPKTVSLSKAVNIRDYAGTLMFADEKIRLYYNIRVLQDYINEHRVNLSILNTLPKVLLKYIEMDKEILIKKYREANYSILEQEMKKPISIDEFHDFLELIKLGHYEITDKKIKEAINFYNYISDSDKIKSINDVSIEQGMDVERRLTKRLMERKKIKSESREMCFYIFRHGETEWNVESRIKGQLEDSKINFTKKGILQIEKITNILSNRNIQAIFTSDLYRTKKTAKMINDELQIKIYYCKNFRGLNMGNFQGKLMEDFLKDEQVKKAFDNFDCIIPGGESINQLNNRFIEGLEIIMHKYLYQNVAIISHGAAISNLKAKLTGNKYEDIDYCVIKCYNNEYRVLDYGKYE